MPRRFPPSRLPPVGPMVFITARHHLSRRGTPRRYKRPSPKCACAPHRHRSRQWYRHGGMVCAHGGDGQGNLRVAKTPPLQSGVCGDGIAIPMLAIAASMPHMETLILYNFYITTRHAASLRSSRNGIARLNPLTRKKRQAPHKRLNHTGLFLQFPFWNTVFFCLPLPHI